MNAWIGETRLAREGLNALNYVSLRVPKTYATEARVGMSAPIKCVKGLVSVLISIPEGFKGRCGRKKKKSLWFGWLRRRQNDGIQMKLVINTKALNVGASGK